MFAFETYGLEPDIVVLGKGLGNGVPVAAAVGRFDLFASMEYGAGSDTWSANPLASAAVMATLDCYNAWPVLDNVRKVSPVIEEGLLRLKKLPFVKHVRGEQGGMVWGIEVDDHAGMTGAEVANACVLACYQGRGDDGIHLLGPLAKKVLRIAPPLVITEDQANAALKLMEKVLAVVAAAKR
jgi:4-aminobutyrate aminotransferase-like enzyme